MPALRTDQAFIQVQLGGVNPVDTEDTPYTALQSAIPQSGWTAMEGGDIEGEDVKTRPGGMRGQISLGGPPTRSDVTVMVQYSWALDAIYQQIESMSGKRSMAVSWTILDADGNPNTGNQTNTVTGILKNVSRPNFNANTIEAGFLTLTMSCHV